MFCFTIYFHTEQNLHIFHIKPWKPLTLHWHVENNTAVWMCREKHEPNRYRRKLLQIQCVCFRNTHSNQELEKACQANFEGQFSSESSCNTGAFTTLLTFTAQIYRAAVFHGRLPRSQSILSHYTAGVTENLKGGIIEVGYYEPAKCNNDQYWLTLCETPYG